MSKNIKKPQSQIEIEEQILWYLTLVQKFQPHHLTYLEPELKKNFIDRKLTFFNSYYKFKAVDQLGNKWFSPEFQFVLYPTIITIFLIFESLPVAYALGILILAALLIMGFRKVSNFITLEKFYKSDLKNTLITLCGQAIVYSKNLLGVCNLVLAFHYSLRFLLPPVKSIPILAELLTRWAGFIYIPISLLLWNTCKNQEVVTVKNNERDIIEKELKPKWQNFSKLYTAGQMPFFMEWQSLILQALLTQALAKETKFNAAELEGSASENAELFAQIKSEFKSWKELKNLESLYNLLKETKRSLYAKIKNTDFKKFLVNKDLYTKQLTPVVEFTSYSRKVPLKLDGELVIQLDWQEKFTTLKQNAGRNYDLTLP